MALGQCMSDARPPSTPPPSMSMDIDPLQINISNELQNKKVVHWIIEMWVGRRNNKNSILSMEASIWKLKISGTIQPNRSYLTHCNAALNAIQERENWLIYLRIRYLEEPPCKLSIESQLWMLHHKHNKPKFNQPNKQSISKSKKRFPKQNRNVHHNNLPNLNIKLPKMSPFK